MQPQQKYWLQLANDPTTPTAQLEALAKENLLPHVAAALLKNPNISPAVLLSLNPYSAAEILKNPALPLLLLEDPAFLFQLNEYALAGLVRFSEFPAHLLPVLASHQSTGIREAVAARCTSQHLDILQTLSYAQEEQVQYAVVMNYYTPQSLLLSMIHRTRESIASIAKLRYEKTPTDVLCQIAESWNKSLRQMALTCPHYPKEHLDLLIRAGAAPDLSRATPRRTLGYLTPEECLRLANGGPFAKELLITHPQATDESLCVLLQFAEWSIYKRAMTRRGLSERVLRALIKGCSYADIRDVPRSMLPFMAEHSEPHHIESVAARPDLPEKYLNELIEHRNPRIVYKALCNPKATPEMLLRFYKHPKTTFRRAVARHPNTPTKALISLLGDAHQNVRDVAAKNPNTPKEIIKSYQLAEQRQASRTLRLKQEARKALSLTPYGRQLLRPKIK
jgi:hypothetical protein